MSTSGEVWFPGAGWHPPSTNKPVANHPWPVLRGLAHHANEDKVRLCPSRASVAARHTWSHSLSLQPSPVPLGLEVRPRAVWTGESVGASVSPSPELVHQPLLGKARHFLMWRVTYMLVEKPKKVPGH